MPAVDLRELVKSPIALTGMLVANRDPHPLHSGLKRTKEFTSRSAPPIALPKSGRGLQRLKLSLQDQIPGISASQSHESFIRLLGQAHALHIDTGQVFLGPDGAALNEEERTRTRSVLLVGVFRHDDEQFQEGILSPPRFAGVGTLSVLSKVDEPKHLDDAWLRVEWVHSTAALLHSLKKVAGLRLEPPSNYRRIEILLAPDLPATSTSLEADIALMAHALGASPQIHVLTPEQKGNVSAKVRASNPFELVVIGKDVDEAVVSEFTRRHGEKSLHRAPVADASDARLWFLDNFPRIMGVGPGLIRYPEIAPAPGRPGMPVQQPTQCLHHGDNIYVFDAATNQWWTRDFAQHGSTGKSVFKTYSKNAGELLWEADRDGLGLAISGKHKGSEGLRISVASAHACPRPESHLR